MTTYYRTLSYGFAAVGVAAAVIGTALAVDGAYRWAAVEAVTIAACAVMAVKCRRFADEEAET